MGPLNEPRNLVTISYIWSIVFYISNSYFNIINKINNSLSLIILMNETIKLTKKVSQYFIYLKYCILHFEQLFWYN